MSSVAVVGSGLIGRSCAWHLARAGHRVALFDIAAQPREASWAAAGMLAPHHEATRPDALWRLCALGLQCWGEFLAGLGVAPEAVDWQAGGGWLRAADTAALDRLEGELRWLRATGVEVLRLSPAAFARVCPAAAPGAGALWLPGAQVDPRRVLAALHAACVAAGVVERCGPPVEGLDGATLRTADGASHAYDEVVLASGAWTPGLAVLAGFALAGEPVKGQLIRLPGPLRLPGFLRDGQRYLLTRADGTVVVGATMVEAGFDRSTDPLVASGLAAWAATAVPALAGQSAVETWTGLRPRLASGLPMIGRVRPGLCLATGHFRNGVLLAPLTGEAIAAVLSGGGTEPTLSAFDPHLKTA